MESGKPVLTNQGEAQEGSHIHIIMPDSHYYTTKNQHNIVNQFSTNLKKKKGHNP